MIINREDRNRFLFDLFAGLHNRHAFGVVWCQMFRSISIVLFTLMLTSFAYAGEFISDNFMIEIESLCPEGEVTCSDVKFSITLPGFENNPPSVIYGKTVHTKCSDGITPCNFKGYEFYSEGSQYFIYNSGLLVISDEQGNILLSEIGKWN